MRQNKYEYDAFISHAVEDKIPIANELCAKLERAGLRVWYSGKELGLGDSIEKTIARGLNRSRYGIVIFSPTYLAKNWTIREFYTLLAKEIEEQKVILPVLYNITLDELKNKDMVMADRFAVNADRGLDYVVDRIMTEIERPVVQVKKKEAWFSKVWLVLMLSLLANVALLLKGLPVTGSFDHSASARLGQENPVQDAYAYPTGLLGELQGLLTAMSTCAHEDIHGPASPHHAALAGKNGTFSISGNDCATAGNRIDAIQGAGKKVTMAIVFQIEDPRPTPPNVRETDDVFQTISLRDEGNTPLTLAEPDVSVANDSQGRTRIRPGERLQNASERKTHRSESF